MIAAVKYEPAITDFHKQANEIISQFSMNTGPLNLFVKKQYKILSDIMASCIPTQPDYEQKEISEIYYKISQHQVSGLFKMQQLHQTSALEKVQKHVSFRIFVHIRETTVAAKKVEHLQNRNVNTIKLGLWMQ
jgi:hypothetical protein